MLPLALGGQQQTGQHTVRIRAIGGAGTDADVSKNLQVSK